ncbi:MAG: type II toxin-antitoxin system RelE/ParE family toxin [Erysipelotrichaceae bacterium]
MKYKVIITDKAKQDLREISFRIANQEKDINLAKKFVSKLYDKCKKLDTFPDGDALPKDRVLLSAGYGFIRL